MKIYARDGSLSSGYTNISTFTVSPNQNLLKEQASFAAVLNDANLHTYDISYAPATGVMTVKRDSVAVGTYTDPQPSMQGNFVLPMSNLVKADFDNLVITAQQQAGAPPVRSVYYSHSDHLGSSSVVTDANGAIAQQLDYLPYGEERINEQAPAAGGTAPFDTKKKYTGKELDSETGLYYYGARYYDSRIGRFVSLDPTSRDLSSKLLFVEPQRFNSYSYAGNNPIRYTDPNGQDFVDRMEGLAVGLWNGLTGTASGLYQIISHPIETTKAAVQQLGDNAAFLYEYANTHTGQQFINDLEEYANMSIDSFNNLSDFEKGRVIGQITEKVMEVAVVTKGASSLGKKLSNAPVKSINISNHAQQRMLERGITIGQVQETMQKTPFEYFHEGTIKNGYYNPTSKVFVSQIKETGNITTVINNVDTKYIENLKSINK